MKSSKSGHSSHSPVPRVVFLTTSPAVGGAETQLWYLLRDRPRDTDWKVYSWFSAQSRNAAGRPLLSELFRSQPSTFTELSSVRARVFFALEMIRRPPDIIQVFGIRPLLFVLAIRRLCPRPPQVIVSLLGDHRRWSVVHRKVMESARRDIRLVLSNSDSLIRRFIHDFPSYSNITAVIPNGIDAAHATLSDNMFSLREEMGCNSDCFLVLMIGTLIPVKRHEDAIRAIHLLVSTIPNIRLAIVGHGPLKSYLQRLLFAHNLKDEVRLLGAKPHASALMKEADVVLLSSDSEGMSNVVMEAMANGKPIVATKVGDIPVLIREGEDGLLVPPRRPDLIATAIHQLYSNPEKALRMGQSAQSRVRSSFSIEEKIRRTQNLYAQLTNQVEQG